MHLLLFTIFLCISWFLLMQLYRFSTYHLYFLKVLPVLIVYAALSAFILWKLELHEFFLWHIGLMIFFLARNYKKNAGFIKEADSIVDDEEARSTLHLSLKRTLKYHLLSSITYLLIFSVVYLILFNGKSTF